MAAQIVGGKGNGLGLIGCAILFTVCVSLGPFHDLHFAHFLS